MGQYIVYDDAKTNRREISDYEWQRLFNLRPNLEFLLQDKEPILSRVLYSPDRVESVNPEIVIPIIRTKKNKIKSVQLSLDLEL